MTEDFNADVAASLTILSDAKNYHHWIWEKIAPFAGARILEVGAGVGSYSIFLMPRERVILSDYDPDYRAVLEEKYGHREHTDVIDLDLVDLTEESRQRLTAERLDTVICLNVLEHIENDEAAIAFFRDVLTPGGRVVLVNPAHQFLFSQLDRLFGHHRRYDAPDARRLADATGMNLVVSSFFNLFGMVGWLVNHRLLGKTELDPGQTMLFNRLVPFVKPLDLLAMRRLGQSMLIVLEKPLSEPA